MLISGDVAHALAKLAEAYRESVGESTCAVYFEALADLDPRDFDAAVRQHIRESKWFPKPAELRALAAEARGERITTEREAQRRRTPVAALAADVGDPAENLRGVRALLADLYPRLVVPARASAHAIGPDSDPARNGPSPSKAAALAEYDAYLERLGLARSEVTP